MLYESIIESNEDSLKYASFDENDPEGSRPQSRPGNVPKLRFQLD